MAVYRRSARPRFTLLLLVLTSATVLTLDQRGQGSTVIDSVKSGARDVLAPVQGAAERVVRPFGDFFGGIFDYRSVKEENERLREQLAEGRGQVLRATDAERERQALLALQDLEFTGDIPAVAARGIGDAASNFTATVEIDRGTSSGVADGMPVVGAAGLVGRVVEVGRHRATVLLLIDRTARVGIRLATSGDVGVASGRGRDQPLTVDLIDPGTAVERGEAVVTSGLEQSAFPQGIPVGKVLSARQRAGALQQDVLITPAADFGHLEFVKVLLWSASGS